jgi:Zn-dependent peptidase ImmA (M78 family)
MTFAKTAARVWFAGLALLATLLGCSASTPLLPAPRATPSATPWQPLDPSDAPTQRPPETLPDLEEIQGQVSTVRGLYPTGPLDRQLIAPEELGQRVEEDFLDEYTAEQAADDVRVLSLFGLVEPGFDLLDFHLGFYEEQVAGYYDTEIERMYVVGSQWGGAERLTYAHEYVHALQDQTYDLEGGLGYNDETCQQDSERCAAISALIEGDATLAEEQWWQAYSTQQDYEDLLASIEAYRGDIFNAAPAYIRQDFLFPYDQGLQFVRALFRRGGWAAVDAAYLDPPTTTEQILHPELYGKEMPLPVEVPDRLEALGEGWHELEAGVLGEWFTRLVLDEEVPSWEAADAAAGWGGDAYRAYASDAGDRSVLVLMTRWDSPRDAFEFVEAFHAYGGWRFGERRTEQTERRWTWHHGSVLLERAYDETLWIVAPDEATQVALREAIEFPAR